MDSDQDLESHEFVEKVSNLNIKERLHDEEHSTKTTSSSRRTALVYDERMAKHCNIWELDHPECPDRILKPYQALKEEGLVERCKTLQSRMATRDDLLTLHRSEYVQEMASTSQLSLGELLKKGESYDSIYLSEHVYESALLSAGCTLELLDAVLSHQADNGLALVRPPGHHALENCAMGFCYFNNVAIAAQIARRKYGVKRVLIVDWDIHYGNGTHRMFEDDPNILYFSIHRYDNGAYWPCLPEANYDHVGKQKGQGFTILVPWNKRGMGNGDYFAAFNLLLMPVACEFNPDLVLVSCGFDSGIGDPRGLCRVTPEGFAHMTNMLLGLAGGKVLLILEGGYNISTVANCTISCIRSLLGDPCPKMEATKPCKSALESILNAVKVHSTYWHCLKWINLAVNLGLETHDGVQEKNIPAKGKPDCCSKENEVKDPDLIQDYSLEMKSAKESNQNQIEN